MTKPGGDSETLGGATAWPRRARFALPVLAALAILVGACGGDPQGAQEPAPPSQTDDPAPDVQNNDPLPDTQTDDAPAAEESLTIEDRNAALGRGINIGDALEAPNEGDWGVTIEDSFFDIIAEAGFDSVRIPISWSTHASTEPPYTIDPEFFSRVDHVLDQVQRVGLTAVIDMHHYAEIFVDPAGETDRFVAMWSQIAERYADQPQSVYFEPLNEPSDAFSDQPQLWNELFAEALEAIRRTNPDRAVVVGPVAFNSLEALNTLTLPPDPNLIVTIHYYDPFKFTHQGAGWVDPVPPVGTTWFPDDIGLGPIWQDYSWGTTVQGESDGLILEFNEPGAAFSVHTTTAFTPATVSLDVSGAASLDVVCDPAGSFDVVGRIESTEQWSSYEVDLSSCGPGTTDLAFQNVADDTGPIAIRDIEVCDTTSCNPVLTTNADRLSALFAEAQEWAQANDRPIYVGEFGAYSPGDMESRARWTAAVQESALAAGMSTAYWEFIAGFGAYDGDTDQWRQPLLDALLG